MGQCEVMWSLGVNFVEVILLCQVKTSCQVHSFEYQMSSFFWFFPPDLGDQVCVAHQHAVDKTSARERYYGNHLGTLTTTMQVVAH